MLTNGAGPLLILPELSNVPVTWEMRSSPAKGWAKTGQMAPPLAQSSPPEKEEQGRRESERREKV